MFEACVLGVDPGLATTGIAALSRRPTGQEPAVLWADTVRTPPDMDEPRRLRRVFEAVRSAIATHRPEAVAVERIMWGQNKTSGLSVARATGVVLLAAAQAGVAVEEYAPLEIKMAVTGVGNAGKEQVRSALQRAHRIRGLPASADAIDAVAVALCHLRQSRLRSAARQAGAR